MRKLPADREPSARPAAAARKLRILLVEDNPANQKLAAYVLEGRGHVVEIAGDGQEAVLLAQHNRYDVILMDVQMPGMDGFDTTAAIRERQNGASLAPIIAMTAHATASDRQRCLAAGMDGYLPKPIDADEMIVLVESQAAGPSAANAAAATMTCNGSEPVAPPAAAVFDRKLALKQCLGNGNLLDQVIDFFSRDVEGFLVQMCAALQRGDLAEVGHLGHRLKGTLVYLGAEPAREAARRVERLMLHGGGQAEAEEDLRTLERECSLLKEALLMQRAEASSSRRQTSTDQPDCDGEQWP